jgi:hypothetical protein
LSGFCSAQTPTYVATDPNGGTVNYGTYGTYDPASPSSQTVGFGGADFVRKYRGGNPAVVVPASTLGFPANASYAAEGPRILAAATGDDVFPVWGLFDLGDTSGMPAFSQTARFQFSAVGSSETAPDFNPGVVLGTEWQIESQGPPHVGWGPFVVDGTYVAGDARAALTWSDVPLTPVLFTVDWPTAQALSGAGIPCNSCDILYSLGDGSTPPSVVFHGDVVGLDPMDEITALAVNQHGCAIIVLGKNSPTVGTSIGNPPITVTATTLLGFVPTYLSNWQIIQPPAPNSTKICGSLFHWCSGDQALLGVNDASYGGLLELRDLAVHDPTGPEYDPATSVNPYDYAQGSFPFRNNANSIEGDRLPLLVNGCAGDGVQHVRALTGTDAAVELNLGDAGVTPWEWGIYVTFGRPPEYDSTDLPVLSGVQSGAGTVFDLFAAATFGLVGSETAGNAGAFLFPSPEGTPSVFELTIPADLIPTGEVTFQAVVLFSVPGSGGSSTTMLAATNSVTLSYRDALFVPPGWWP